MKDTYTASENPSLSELEEDILQHMPRRFKVRGRIQRMFLMCKASKGVEDIFSGNHQLWKPFDAASSVCEHDDFPAHCNWQSGAMRLWPQSVYSCRKMRAHFDEQRIRHRKLVWTSLLLASLISWREVPRQSCTSFAASRELRSFSPQSTLNFSTVINLMLSDMTIWYNKKLCS